MSEPKISIIHEVGDLGVDYGVSELSQDEANKVRSLYEESKKNSTEEQEEDTPKYKY